MRKRKIEDLTDLERPQLEELPDEELVAPITPPPMEDQEIGDDLGQALIKRRQDLESQRQFLKNQAARDGRLTTGEAVTGIGSLAADFLTGLGGGQSNYAGQAASNIERRKQNQAQALKELENEDLKILDTLSKGRKQKKTIDPLMLEQLRFENKKALQEQRLGQMADIFGKRQAAAEAKLQKSQQEKERRLEVPGLGQAITEADAKELKTGLEEKASFDRKLDELIELRETSGAETLDREKVARAKQLSKDLLLTYKNMARLGVLSQADEDIINAIIPPDPLEFKTAQLFGQDPILNILALHPEFKNHDAMSTNILIPTVS